MSLTRNVPWLLGGRWVYNLTTLISFTIIVAMISPSDFGIYALASTFLILSDTFFSDGVENLVVRESGEEEDVAQTAFWVSVGFSAIIAFVVAVFAIPFGWFYKSTSLELATQAIAVIIIVQGAASVPRALLMRRDRSRQYATNSALSNMIGAAAGIGTAFAGAGLWSLIIQQGCLQIAMLTLCCIAARFKPRINTDRRMRRTFAKHVATMLWSSVLNVLGNRLDILMIGLSFGEAATGVYGLAKRIVQIIQDLVASSFDKILLSMISREQMIGQAERIYRSSVIMQGITAIPSFTGVAVTGSVLLPMVFGYEWAGAAPLIALMAVGGIFRSMVTIERARQLSSGQITLIARIRLIELALGVIMIVPFSALGVGYMAVVFSIRYVIGYVLVVISRIGIAEAPKSIWKTMRWLAFPLLANILMAIAVHISLDKLELISPPEIRLILSIFVGIVVFVGTLIGTQRWWLHLLVVR